MLDLLLNVSPERAPRVLCIGAHCDDIEIGCGGTLVALCRRHPGVMIDWVVLSGTERRRNETRHAQKLLLAPANRGALRFGDFPDGRFPDVYGPIKEFSESLKAEPAPDLILCHERADRHQDHRIVNEMVWNTFRDHTVLEYEIPKWDGGLGQPNLYVALTEADCESKVNTLLGAYPSQSGAHWFTRDTFLSLARLRGLECRSASRYAEAFHARKLVLAG